MNHTESVSTRDIFLKNLRSGTAFWHQKLEDLDGSKAILDPNVSIEQYIKYLTAMYGFIRPLEAHIYPQLSTIIENIEARRKTSLMEHDLKALGLSEIEIKNIPIFTFMPMTNAAAMGAMYVIEGSTLGGAIIYKHIHKSLNLTTENGAGYFQPYGQSSGSFWKSFLANMTDFATDNKEAEVIDGATETFKNIHDWFIRLS